MSFTVDKVQADVGEEITFTNTSLDTESCMWLFQDRTSSTDWHTKHAYSEVGEYQVILKGLSKRQKYQSQAAKDISIWPKNISGKYFGSFRESYDGGSTCPLKDTVSSIELYRTNIKDEIVVLGLANRFDSLRLNYDYVDRIISFENSQNAADYKGVKYEIVSMALELSTTLDTIFVNYNLFTNSDQVEICKRKVNGYDILVRQNEIL